MQSILGASCKPFKDNLCGLSCGDMVNIFLQLQFIEITLNIETVLPSGFARLEFKVLKDNVFLNKLHTFTLFTLI